MTKRMITILALIAALAACTPAGGSSASPDTSMSPESMMPESMSPESMMPESMSPAP